MQAVLWLIKRVYFSDSPGIYKKQCETLKTNSKLITKQAFHLLSDLPQAMTITCLLLSIYYHKTILYAISIKDLLASLAVLLPKYCQCYL